jgi:shikimate dehydrogenase
MLVGLIGANIQDSMSPALFADAFAAAGIDGYYHLLDVDRLSGRSLPQLLDAIKAAGFAGANVTYPFKQAIIPLLDAVDPEAAPPVTISIAAAGATASWKAWGATAREAGRWCKSAPAAPGAPSPSP